MKTYRETRNPTKAARKAAINFMMENEAAVLGNAAKILARCKPNRYSHEDRPNRLAHQTAMEIPGKFSRWLLGKTGYLVTHCEGQKMTTGHSFWTTFNGFCKFSQAARPDSAGKARRSTTQQRKVLSDATEAQRAHLDRINDQLATGLITERMAESLTMDLLNISYGPDAETISKNSRRYRSKPRQHTAVAGVDPMSDDLTGAMASIERRLESGDITPGQAADEALELADTLPLNTRNSLRDELLAV